MTLVAGTFHRTTAHKTVKKTFKITKTRRTDAIVRVVRKNTYTQNLFGKKKKKSCGAVSRINHNQYQRRVSGRLRRFFVSFHAIHSLNACDVFVPFRTSRASFFSELIISARWSAIIFRRVSPPSPTRPVSRPKINFVPFLRRRMFGSCAVYKSSYDFFFYKNCFIFFVHVCVRECVFERKKKYTLAHNSWAVGGARKHTHTL